LAFGLIACSGLAWADLFLSITECPMADDIDRASEYAERMREYLVRQHRAAAIPEGRPGECDFCGEESPRIVNGYCAKCRDQYGFD